MPNPIPLPDNLATRLRALEDRIDTLERAARTSVGIANGSVTLLAADANGWNIPVLVTPWRKFGDQFVTTSATFTTAYRTNVRNLLGAGILVDVAVNCDPSTTGEVRLNLAGTLAGVASCAAGVTTNVAWRWAHGFPLGGNGVNRQLDLEVRRVSGAGNVSVSEPQPLVIATTVTGVTLTATGL